MTSRALFFIAFLPVFFGCQSETGKQENTAPDFKAIVEKERQLDSIPSGSGLVKAGSIFYVISDDSPYFFKLNKDFKVLEKNGILKGKKTTAYRLSKATKPDFESAVIGEMNGEKYLLAFGSGSKSPERDSLLLVQLNKLQTPKTYSLKGLYEQIKQQSKLPDAQLNMEGSAIIGEDLYLLNRGQNLLVQTNWQKTLAFLTLKAEAPEIKSYRIALPKLRGIDPGFSGCCQLGSENKLIFTASVENTKSWVEDGEILGSFIGIINVEKLSEKSLENIALLTDAQQKNVIEKVESIEYVRRDKNGDIKVLGLTDDDKGGSKILEITLKP